MWRCEHRADRQKRGQNTCWNARLQKRPGAKQGLCNTCTSGRSISLGPISCSSQLTSMLCLRGCPRGEVMQTCNFYALTDLPGMCFNWQQWRIFIDLMFERLEGIEKGRKVAVIFEGHPAAWQTPFVILLPVVKKHTLLSIRVLLKQTDVKFKKYQKVFFSELVLLLCEYAVYTWSWLRHVNHS